MDGELRKHWSGDEESFQKFQTKIKADAEHLVEKYKQNNNASDGEAALEALSIYHDSGLTPPNWAIEKIRETWEIYKTGIGDGWIGEPSPTHIETFVTLDDALGLKQRTRRSATAMQKKEHLMYWVYLEFQQLYKDGHSPGDVATHNLVGGKFGISGSTAKNYYSEAMDRGYPTISGQERRSTK